MYKTDKDSFNLLVNTLTQPSSLIAGARKSENTCENTSENIDPNIISTIFNSSKPLGNIGETTLNQVTIYLRDFKWEAIINKAEITFHA